MRSFKCNELNCQKEFNVVSYDQDSHMQKCIYCGSSNIRRLWPKAINMNGHGHSNNFEGNKK